MASRTPLILSAKLLRRMVRLMGGHGSALPGLIIGHLDKRFLAHTLSKLPLGIIVVTGTNGKTTTTHMLVELLKSQELRVLSNPSGSNLLRGLISTVVEHTLPSGKLPYDIAVFELDEANAPLFTAQVGVETLVALNVMRDQLDRYGELDTTATLIARAAAQAKMVVVNGNDPLLMEKTSSHPHRQTFGLAANIMSKVSSETDLHAVSSERNASQSPQNDAQIVDIKTTEATIQATVHLYNEEISVEIPILGVHNIVNATAAIMTTKILLPAAASKQLVGVLHDFKPAFGRGETIRIRDRQLTVALIKNPSGFTQNVRTFITVKTDAILIVINDDYADGRDVSWLWDSQLMPLTTFKGVIFVAGKRRYDMALCLKYQNIQHIVLDEDAASSLMERVIVSRKWKSHLLVIPTYTAMLSIRKWLGAKQGRKHIW